MQELNKRILTSILLFVLFLSSLFNKYLLFILLIIFFFETFYEIYKILNKIFIFKNKLALYLFSLISNIYLLIFFIIVWSFLSNDLLDNKINFCIIVMISILSDIGGYCFGKIFGGKKLTKISPNKTYSGMIGSFLLSILITPLIFINFAQLQNLILLAIILSAVTQLGDLLISYLKRKSNLKDTGKILPGHGGLLDRFDGIIFAVPVGALLIKLL